MAPLVMPPRKKAKVKRVKLRDYIAQFKIEFKGPVGPKHWPERHKRHFLTIRDIWATRYDEYVKRNDIDQNLLHKQRTRVRKLRQRAVELREEGNPNERSWRDDLEVPVTERFKDEVVCIHCNNEQVFVDHEAQPLGEGERERLARVRHGRKPCNCGAGSGIARDVSVDSAEQRQTRIFKTVVEQRVAHDSRDSLDNISIPMTPGRIIALRLDRRYTARLNSSLVHSPLNDADSASYPFLVIEAKKEHEASGFRAIEAQTAFPIRRFLKLQLALRTESKVEHDPLVWFLAFRGDEGRLYAGALDDETVHIYTLWCGLLESQDGALQLLQIVDFIWSWARDVYRPQIIRCLRTAGAGVRGVSPSVTLSRSRSRSVLSEAGARGRFTPLDRVQDEEAMQLDDDRPSNFPDATSHQFLRWAGGDQESIRHSDIVLFKYCCVEVPETRREFEDWVQATKGGHERSFLEDPQHHNNTLLLSRSAVLEIGRYWTGAEPLVAPGANSRRADELTRALIYFHTYCRQDDWQIVRELNFLIWSPEAMGLCRPSMGESDIEVHNQISNAQFDLIKHVQTLRGLSGKASVEYALENREIFLCLDFFQKCSERPVPFNGGDWPLVAAVQLFTSILSTVDSDQQISRLAEVTRAEIVDAEQPLPSATEDFAPGGAVLAVRPNLWPLQCARFCLFVVVDRNFDDAQTLGRLLRCTIDQRAVYGVSGENLLTLDDKNILRRWIKSLLNNATGG